MLKRSVQSLSSYRARQKIDNLQSHVHRFSADNLFFNVNHKQGKLRHLTFDTDSTVYSIKD